jgi:hypothetical protein
MENEEYLFLRDNDIDYIITDFEEIEEKKSSIVTPPNNIIIPQSIVTY